jgi:hypothetical protein
MTAQDCRGNRNCGHLTGQNFHKRTEPFTRQGANRLLPSQGDTWFVVCTSTNRLQLCVGTCLDYAVHFRYASELRFGCSVLVPVWTMQYILDMHPSQGLSAL